MRTFYCNCIHTYTYTYIHTFADMIFDIFVCLDLFIDRRVHLCNIYRLMCVCVCMYVCMYEYRHIKVTVGSWSYQALSTVNGATNIWSDANLIAAGGAANGVLDYYQIHYYNGFGSTWSPIQNMMTYWQTYDKPHVIGEIPNNPNPFTASSPQTGSYFYNTLLQNCYSGAWGW